MEMTRRGVFAAPIVAGLAPSLSETAGTDALPEVKPGTVHVGVRYRNGKLLDPGKVYTSEEWFQRTGHACDLGIIDWQVVGARPTWRERGRMSQELHVHLAGGLG